jgi:hypothetical protein
VAQDYLFGRSTLMPVASGLSQTLADPSIPRQGTLPIVSLVPSNVQIIAYNAHTYEVHHFIVRTQAKQLLRLSVTVGYDSQGFPVLVAYPSLDPQPLSRQASSVPPLDYSDSTSKVDVTADSYPQVANVVNAWAKAYITGNSKALGDLTGDPATRNYRALPAGFVLTGNPTIESGVQSTTGLVVRVRVGYQASSANGFAASSDFDLLVANPTTQSAAVVAWGPAGQAAIGTGLTAYMNNEQRH